MFPEWTLYCIRMGGLRFVKGRKEKALPTYGVTNTWNHPKSAKITQSQPKLARASQNQPEPAKIITLKSHKTHKIWYLELLLFTDKDAG